MIAIMNDLIEYFEEEKVLSLKIENFMRWEYE